MIEKSNGSKKKGNTKKLSHNGADVWFRTILYSIGDGVITTDSSGRIQHMNNMAEQLTGWSEGNAKGKVLEEILNVINEDTRVPVENPVKKVLREKTVVGLANHSLLISKSGKETPIMDSAAPIRDGSDEILGVVLLIRDQTAERETQRKLMESQSLLEKTQARAKLGGWEYDLKSKTVYWSKEMYRLHGIEVSDKPPSFEESLKLVHPEDRDQLRGYYHDAVNNGKSYEYEYRTNPEPGPVRIISLKVECVRDSGGEVVRLNGTYLDVTERKKAENALAGERSLLRTVIDNIPDAVYAKDHEGRKILANPSDLNNLGKTGEEVIGKTDFDVYPDKVAEKFVADDKMVMRNGTAILDREELLVNDKGEGRWLLTSKIPWYDKNGNIIGIVGIGHDITRRKNAEEALKKREELLKTTLYSIGDGVITTNASGEVDQMNSVAEELTGWSEEEARGIKLDKVFKIVNEETRETVENPVEKVFRHGTIVGLANHTVLISKDGRETPIADSAAPIKDESDNIIGVVLVFRDQAAERDAEKKLAQERSLLRTVIDNIPDAVYAKDSKGRKILANPADLNNVGKAAEEVLGKTDLEVFPDDVARRFHADDLEVLNEGKSIRNREELLVNEEGEQRWLVTSKLPWRDDEENVIGIVGIGHDITGRKKAEEALRESEERYKQFFEKDLTADYIVTVDGGILMFNPAFLKVFGFNSDDEIFHTDEKTLWPDAEIRREFLETLRQERVLSYYPLELKRRDGSPLHAIANIIGVFDEKNELSRMQIYLFDETPKKLLEEQFRQAQKLESLGTLAGGIAHDFNNILSIIMGHSSMIEPGVTEPSRLEKSVNAINKATERGAALVNQLLTFARKTEVIVQSVKINDIVSEISKLIEETFPKTIDINIDLEENLPSIIADVTQIHQVLLNLCVNARDAMQRGGTLTITTSAVPGGEVCPMLTKKPAEKYVLLKIADTGDGIDEAIQERIFDPFFTTKGPGEGTGLGLSLVYSIVESHNGFITLESEKGKGTTFFIYLPVQKNGHREIDIQLEKAGSVKGGTEYILLIEDEELLREFIESVLVDKGYRVITAGDGEEGVRLYSERQKDISVVITDLGLPKLAGDEVFRSIKEINPAANIVLASGFIDPGMKNKIQKAGVRYIIRKPYSPDDLLKLIREAINPE